jgi:hypothetical protein
MVRIILDVLRNSLARPPNSAPGLGELAAGEPRGIECPPATRAGARVLDDPGCCNLLAERLPSVND